MTTRTPMPAHSELERRCREFVEEQSCGEWSDKDIEMDTRKLLAFVLEEIERAARAGSEG